MLNGDLIREKGNFQIVLFFLLVFLSIVPNAVFFFTEQFSLLTGFASVLLPLSIWMCVFLCFPKPGVMVLILLPKLILDGGQLVLLYLFGESVIAVDMFLNLTSSNASEASELLSNILLVIGCVFFFYLLPTLILAFRSVRHKEQLSIFFRKKWRKRSLVLFLIGVLLSIVSILSGSSFSIKKDVYPANALYNLYFAIWKSGKNTNYKKTSADFSFHSVKKKQVKGRREVYVLVVGETGRAMEWGLYGYERETTPNLQKRSNIVYYKDAITQSNNTHKSVPIILSAASAENYGIIYEQKSIVTAFKEAGFRTVVIANQKLTTSMIGCFYREADQFIDMSCFNTTSSLKSLPDGALLPYLKEELERSDENLFIVLHTYGSHFNYHERYPKDFSIFIPDKVDGIRLSLKNKLRNAYDNTICYTDYVLNEIIKLLDQSNTCAVLTYLSDHGEDIFDDNRHRYLHASPIPTYYQLHIPYVFWFSDNYIAYYPDKYEEVRRHASLPVSTNSVFHTMLDIADIDADALDLHYSLASDVFKVRDRMYLGDHDDPIPFWQIGLKKQDFEMLDKWKIVYDKDGF
ncbi:MAG: sulfatase-like hydrolase/transferase [Massilibacteroides sp.]|nr:sulfatase-like hydrolase/transferase [Massilibacteroides sp.]MDD3063401.1 sulfatase-like hydrolase/transferase [Massilibacteroides sp.]MDD4661144.1 sulfatase-like hydrolase/transferase [Massilibacteroides sp.]